MPGEFCTGCGLEVGITRRVLYRGVCAAWVVGGGLREKVLPARVVCVWTVTIFSLLALDGLKWAVFPVLGEFCTGFGLTRRVLGEFCTGLALRSGLLGEFCTGCGHACRVPGEFCTGACALRGWWVVVCGRKFALQGVRALQTRNFSPSVPKIGQNERFLPCWASFSRCVPGRGFAGRAVSRDKPATQPDAPGSKLVPATPVRKARGNQAVTPAPASSLTPGR